MEAAYLSKNDFGSMGEDTAVEYLAGEGYEILFRNFSCRSGEIDIIAHPRGENIVCFIEVKTRRNAQYGRPAEAVSTTKQKHIRRVATYFLIKEWDSIGADADTVFRFDVVEVEFEKGSPKVTHIPAAFF